MIIEMYKIDNEDSFVTVTLTPENESEEKSIRNAKILHKNNLLVWWGDTLEIEYDGKMMFYNGLKISFRLTQNKPKEGTTLENPNNITI